MPAEKRSSGSPAPAGQSEQSQPPVNGAKDDRSEAERLPWLAANESFLRVLFSIAAYASAILLLVSLFLVGPANLRTKILAAALIVAVGALYLIRRASKSQRERQRAADSPRRRP